MNNQIWYKQLNLNFNRIVWSVWNIKLNVVPVINELYNNSTLFTKYSVL